jgi:hypothetical protein
MTCGLQKNLLAKSKLSVYPRPNKALQLTANPLRGLSAAEPDRYMAAVLPSFATLRSWSQAAVHRIF